MVAGRYEGNSAIAKEAAFEECVVLSKDAFDPDAVFLDDIVDDDVLPCPNLAVDGLTDGRELRKGNLDLASNDVAANEVHAQPDTSLRIPALNPEALEVYGWESSVWRKIKSYFGR